MDRNELTHNTTIRNHRQPDVGVGFAAGGNGEQVPRVGPEWHNWQQLFPLYLDTKSLQLRLATLHSFCPA